MKKLCSCYEKLEAGNKRIVVRTHSFLHENTVFPVVYCIECGAQSFVDKNVLVIDAEDLNVPLDAIVEEFDIVKKQLKAHDITPLSIQLFNIMLAIVWNYGVDYYEKFDKYYFENVRNNIIKYFIEYNPTLGISFLEEQQIYDEYLQYVEQTLQTENSRFFDFESALNNPNIFTSTNHTLYGPASLVQNNYVDTQGVERKSNNSYYFDDKYFREHRSDLIERAYCLHAAIKQTFCMYLYHKCASLPPNLFYEVDTMHDLKEYVMGHVAAHDKLIVVGFLKLFKNILDNADMYLNLTSRTYKEYISELEKAEEFVNEHLG